MNELNKIDVWSRMYSALLFCLLVTYCQICNKMRPIGGVDFKINICDHFVCEYYYINTVFYINILLNENLHVIS